ncbi:response regulator transcription factor [Bacillus sp. 31A1R]|uniref:Response regulator transcription factor n=1 Tax=Robertmurraya mangrovi TaxID=3098077 RepID=A0ABU5IX21_9BACI|nr:response regulator transcription factor [Bacillus sp. 31A1R]MDZ5471685.1 response regulator transcription factor [Bacillus sp. 31A1R]
MERIKIMITEDQDLIRTSLQIVLNIEPDMEVVSVAENGERAFNLCDDEIPDIILMDINMPVMNGIEATKRIKEKFPQIKIIILTTFQEMEYVIDALQAGAEGYLLKAIDTKDLTAGIRVVANGGTLITKDVAKVLFAEHIQKEEYGKHDENKINLSKRELQVLKCIANGLTNQQISDKLYLSIGTIKNYVSNLYIKLDVSNRNEAIRKIQQDKLL